MRSFGHLHASLLLYITLLVFLRELQPSDHAIFRAVCLNWLRQSHVRVELYYLSHGFGTEATHTSL